MRLRVLGCRAVSVTETESQLSPSPMPSGSAVAFPSRIAKTLTVAGLLLVLGTAGMETVTALWPNALKDEALRSACTVVRQQFQPGDLISVAPSWISPLVQRELGALMPVEMLGRADGKRYARIWELTWAGARADDTQGLVAEQREEFGRLALSRYLQKPVTVTMDLTEQLLSAQVLQTTDTGAELPCLWSGPQPQPLPQKGAAGAFVCPQGRVERRVMEIDYQPRRGFVTTLGQGRRTALEFTGISDAAWQGSRLYLWAGLHDYHARKTAIGPAQVRVALDRGPLSPPITILPQQGFVVTPLPLPTGAASEHVIRLELTADQARDHFIGLHAELRR